MNNSTTNLESLFARVEKLESQNRRLKLASAVIVLAGATLFLSGAKLADRVDSQVLRARTVEAQEFVVKDDDGHVFARLALHPNKIEINGRTVIVGPGALQFFGENGKPVWTAPQEPTMVPATR
jgi:hypothetical protein